MLDLNHGSGQTYGSSSRPTDIVTAVNAAIDAALLHRHQGEPPRHYVSTSGLGRACLRQIQFDTLAVPKDAGRDFEPSTLRIFEAGHRGEDVVADWIRAAGFDLRTHRSDGRQFVLPPSALRPCSNARSAEASRTITRDPPGRRRPCAQP